MERAIVKKDTAKDQKISLHRLIWYLVANESIREGRGAQVPEAHITKALAELKDKIEPHLNDQSFLHFEKDPFGVRSSQVDEALHELVPFGFSGCHWQHGLGTLWGCASVPEAELICNSIIIARADEGLATALKELSDEFHAIVKKLAVPGTTQIIRT